MRIRRKGPAEPTGTTDVTDDGEAGGTAAEEATSESAETGADRPAGPYDADELPDDRVPRVDLGSLLVAPAEGRDLRLHVDQKTGTVRAVMLQGPDGAVELRAFAAPRNGDLWSEIRPQIAADATRKGGSATEREGRFGTELLCEVKVQNKEGQVGTQTSRVVGINGPRWLLRATFLGRPARDPDGATDWDALIERVAVRRGSGPMPVGEQLPLQLPPGAQVGQNTVQAPPPDGVAGPGD